MGDLFLGYLSRLCKVSKEDRVGEVVERVREIVRVEREVEEWAERVWRVWLDVVGGMVGEVSVGVLQTKRAWLMVQRVPDAGLVREVGRGYEALVGRADREFGAGIEVAGVEFDACLVRVRFDGADGGQC